MEQYHHKINFTLPSEIKQSIAKKENNKLKDRENIKEIKSKISNKKKKISSKSLYNGHNNLKFNLNIKTDEAKINNQYSKICNKLEEEKKNLQSLNKIIKIHNNNIQTENNYYYSYKCNNSKNKNNQKKNLNKNLNLKKSTYNSIKRNKNFDNNSQILLDLNSNYISNDDNKSFINIISKRKVNDDNSNNKKLFNQYITVNQNNKNNKNIKNKKNTNPKSLLEAINRKISNNNFIERKTLDLPNNDCNNIVINNNENSIYEKVNNFEDNNDGDIKLIKINNLNKNIYKYDSSSTIHYSPNKFYHNIINYKQTNHYINIRNYNKYNNEQSIDNNFTRKSHKQKSENKSNNTFNNQYLYNKVSKNESCPRKRKKIMRNSTNEFNIYDKMENPKYNTRTSIPLNYLLRNTINYMNSKEKKKDEKAFTVNELFRRDSIPKTLSINSIDYEPQVTNPTIVPSKTNFTKKYFYQNTDNNIKIREGKSKDKQNDAKIFKKIRMPNNNNSEHIFRINKENQNHISINDNSISNYNTEYLENNYDINNTENIDIHYYKKKIYNISLPKTNTMDDLYSSNILNNLKPTGTLLSSKESYLDFNTMNKSKTNTTCSRKKIFVKKENISPQKKLSNSIVYKERDNNSYETDFHIKNPKNDKMKIINRNNKINNDNFCYVKKNTTILNEKDNNKLEANLIKMTETKYNFIIQNFNSDEKVLTSRSLKKNYKFNENDDLIYNTNTEEKVPSKGRIVYTKPLKYTSTSKTKTINNNFTKQNLNRKKYSLNNSIESFNNVENNFSVNYSKKPLHLKKIIKNNFNYILKTDKRNKIVNNENEEKQINYNDNNKKEILSDNSNKKEISTYEDKIDIFNFHIIDKSKIHCHYKKLYNYCITIPIKKDCYIEKVRNDKFIEFNSFNENLNMNDTFELKSENKNVTFNGKNIIPKIDKLKENNNLKTNGSDEIININFESYGKNKNILEVNRISPTNINKNKTDHKISRIEITEEKTPNKDLYVLLDNNNNSITQNNRAKFSNSTKDKFYKKDDLSRKLQICLATNKLSNIFITKKEKDDIPKRRATTEEKFALGCTKLYNIFRRKSPPPNLMHKNLYLNEYQNIQVKKNNNMVNENESSMEIIDNKNSNNLSKMKKKSYTYIPKKRHILTDNNQNSTKNNNEDKDLEEEENIIKMKTQIINLLNIVNMNNLNTISGNISDIILFYDCKNMNVSKKKISQRYLENENILISAIFNKIIFGKCDLSLYAQLCKKINLFVFKEIKNRTNVNREENLFDKMIKEYYKRLYNKEYYNKVNSDNAKELNIIQNKFIYLTNFISELILCKLVKKNESVQLIKELYNEYEKYDNNIKYIFLKGSIILLESLLEIIFQYQNCDDVLLDLENFIKNQLKNVTNDKNISNNLKNKVDEIIGKFNEFKEPIIDSKNKNINDVNDVIIIQSDRTEKENDKLFINNNNKNNIMTFKNNYCQEENGGKDINKISDIKNLVNKIKSNNSEKIGYKFNIIEENENNQNTNDYNIKKNLFEINNDENNFDNKSEVSVKLNNKRLTYVNNSSNRKRKSRTKKKCKSTDKIKKINDTINDIIDDNKIYELVSKDFDNYLEFLKNERIKIKNDFYVEINDKYNWKEIDDLIMVKKVKLEEIIKKFIQICKNRKDINKNDIFKTTEYIKALIEYYTNTLSNNQIEIFHLYMIETFMDINNIVENDDNEIMHEIMGNLLFILLKNKLYYIKDLNNFIDKNEETKINIAKVVKYTIIASGNFSKQYHNDFKYTKLFNNSDLFVNYVTNELGDINKK